MFRITKTIIPDEYPLGKKVITIPHDFLLEEGIMFSYHDFVIHLEVHSAFLPGVIGFPDRMLTFDRRTPDGNQTDDLIYPLYVGCNFTTRSGFPGELTVEEITSTQQIQALYEELLEYHLISEVSLKIIRAIHREASKYSSFMKKLTVKPSIDPYFYFYAVLILGFTFPVLEVFHFVLNPPYEVI